MGARSVVSYHEEQRRRRTASEEMQRRQEEFGTRAQSERVVKRASAVAVAVGTIRTAAKGNLKGRPLWCCLSSAGSVERTWKKCV